MTLTLQGCLITTTATVLPKVRMKCQCCGHQLPLTGAEDIDVEEGLIPWDIEESIAATMASDGWVSGNCPGCVHTRGDLIAAQDKDDRDEDRDMEGGAQ